MGRVLRDGDSDAFECALTLVELGQGTSCCSDYSSSSLLGCSVDSHKKPRRIRRSCEFVIKGVVEFDDKNNIIKLTNDTKCHHIVKKGASGTRIIYNKANGFCDVCKKWFCAPPPTKAHNRNCFALHKELDEKCRNATFRRRT